MLNSVLTVSIIAFNKTGLIFQTKAGVHVCAANDESLQMPQWAICHTERREQSWRSLANTWTDTHTQTHTLSPPHHCLVFICCNSRGQLCGRWRMSFHCFTDEHTTNPHLLLLLSGCYPSLTWKKRVTITQNFKTLTLAALVNGFM